MKHLIYMIIFSLQCTLFMTGCKVVNWGKKTFKQVDRYDKKLIEPMQKYIKSDMSYDEFNLASDFNALLLNDDARMIYVDYYKKTHHLSDERESILRKRLINENRYNISFYVLGAQEETSYPEAYSLFIGGNVKCQPLLGERDSEWQIIMEVDGKLYSPESIRSVELPTEYKHFFGDRFNQFKSTYFVKFDVLDENDYPILYDENATISLKFISPKYKTEMKWKDVKYFN